MTHHCDSYILLTTVSVVPLACLGNDQPGGNPEFNATHYRNRGDGSPLYVPLPFPWTPSALFLRRQTGWWTPEASWVSAQLRPGVGHPGPSSTWRPSRRRRAWAWACRISTDLRRRRSCARSGSWWYRPVLPEIGPGPPELKTVWTVGRVGSRGASKKAELF